MTALKFTELNPAVNTKAIVNLICDCTHITITDFDLVADPMTVDVDTSGTHTDGSPITSSVVRSFPQADWSGEDVTVTHDADVVALNEAAQARQDQKVIDAGGILPEEEEE